MSDFIERLTACANRGSLSVADLHHWFGVPYPTMHAWLHGKHRPENGSYGSSVDVPDDLVKSLDRLERHIRKHNGFPVPLEHSGFKRPKYIRRVRDGHDRASVSRQGASR